MVYYAFIELSLENCTMVRQTNTRLVFLLYLDSKILDISLEKGVQTCGALEYMYLVLI
jgi:hypothetical protein